MFFLVVHSPQFINHLPNRTIEIEGQEFLYFSGTSYLGLPQNPHFQWLIQERLIQYGNVYGSSRNGNLQLDIYDQAEAKLATWTGAEAALTLSSGMLAGQAVVRFLMLEGYQFFYAADTHPAVWHLPDVSQLVVGSLPLALEGSKICYVTNAVDALRGKLYGFNWLDQWPNNQPLTLVVDDSHGLGVTGHEGAGAWTRIAKRPNIRLIVTASLAKAMGLAAGVILADANTIQGIRHTAYFGGCSPAAPYQLAAYVEAGDLYQTAQHQLQQNISAFVAGIHDLGLFSYTEGYPVFYTEHDDLYPFLLNNGILIYSFAYPKPTDKPNTRIVISAWHNSQDIQRLTKGCRAFVHQSS